jgi:GMP synthase PP-ATPase subunit
MTPEIWLAFAAIFVPAITGVIVSFRNHSKLGKIEIQINGRLSELMNANVQAAKAAGVVIGGMDSATLRAAIREALAETLSTPVLTDSSLSRDTNSRVQAIQQDADAVATALAVKNASDSAKTAGDTAAALVTKAATTAEALLKTAEERLRRRAAE